MKLILNCSSNNENYSGGCDYILVDLDVRLARLALARIGMVRAMHEKDNELWAMTFWDYSPVWFAPWPEDNGLTGQTEEQSLLLEELTEDADPGCCKPVADDVTIPDCYHARTECDFMMVSDDDIHWECYPKHCDITITSAHIPVSLIQEVLKGEAVPA